MVSTIGGIRDALTWRAPTEDESEQIQFCIRISEAGSTDISLHLLLSGIFWQETYALAQGQWLTAERSMGDGSDQSSLRMFEEGGHPRWASSCLCSLADANLVMEGHPFFPVCTSPLSHL